MKILHLYSDWKWTGPAEPVLQACQGLQKRGHEVVLALPRPADPNALETVPDKATHLYDLTVSHELYLDRYLSPLPTIRDLWNAPRFFRQFDVIHTHLSHDHALGGLCARLAGRKRPLVVRTIHKRDVLRENFGNRLQTGSFADGILVFTNSFRERYLERFGLPENKVRLQPLTIDVDRFAPQSPTQVREELGIAIDAPVVGLVTRFQEYRRTDIFLQAAAEVLRAKPEARFLLLGNSSQTEKTVIQPMRELGVAEQVIVGGYRIDDYVETLASMDIFSLLMPGFDGTARAVREAMALGKPCVVTDYGMLPEIVDDSQTGRVVPFTANGLSSAWLELINDEEKRKQMGQAARTKAETEFQIDNLATSLEASYEAWHR